MIIPNRLPRTIDGNVEVLHSVQLYSYVTCVNLVFVSDKIINNSDRIVIEYSAYPTVK